MKKYITICTLFSIALFGYAMGDGVQKSIKFSHAYHVSEMSVKCTECHTSVLTSENANDRVLPSKEDCANCHDVDDDEGCTSCHLDLDNAEAFPNPTRKINFNHKAHAGEEDESCLQCHAGVENAGEDLGSFLPSQGTCNACHNGLSASMDCYSCHAADTQFRPDSHIPTWSREHMVQVRAGQDDCAHCHTNNYCQQCHEPTDLLSTKILPENSYSAYAPKLDGQQTMILKSVHELNYRYVHQLDAMDKEKDCQTCHDNSFYCSECHSGGGVNEMIRPAWHGGADWGAQATGVGSGGGRHAELARRDIERCAACHDMQGADPSCLLCHSDFDGIRYTDPKTHESGFSNRFGEHSSFHNDDGAICFNCHVNTNQAGIGFCGYCHGHK